MSTLRIVILILVTLNALAFAGIKGWLGAGAPSKEQERISTQLNPERIRLATDSPAQGLQASLEPAAQAYDPTPEQLPPLPMPATASETQAAAATSALPLTAAAENVADRGAEEDPLAAPPALSAAEATAEPATEQADVLAPMMEAPVAATAPTTSCFVWSALTEGQADALSRRLRRSGADPERSRSDTPNSWWVRIPAQGSRSQAERRAEELRALGVKDLFIVQEAGPTQYAISLGVFKTENRARVLLNQLRNQGVRNAGVEARMTTRYRVQANLPTDMLRTVESSVPGIARNRSTCPRR